MERRLVLAAAMLALSGLLAATPAAAQGGSDAERRARAHFGSATTYYETGDWESALREFRAAYAEQPRYELRYNIYLCEERLGHLVEAEEALAAYLDALPSDATDRATLALRLENLRRRVRAGATSTAGAAAASSTTDASDTADATDASGASAGADGTAVDPGASAGADGAEAAPDGGLAVVALAPEGSDASPPVPGVGASEAGSSAALVTMGVGLSLAGLGAVGVGTFGGLALSEDGALATRCAAGGCIEADVATLRTLSLAADVSLGVGAAGLVAGLVGAVVWAGEPSRGERAVAVLPVVSPGQLGVAIGGRL